MTNAAVIVPLLERTLKSVLQAAVRAAHLLYLSLRIGVTFENSPSLQLFPVASFLDDECQEFRHCLAKIFPRARVFRDRIATNDDDFYLLEFLRNS